MSEKVNQNKNIHIKTNRFNLLSLKESHVNNNYLGWMKDEIVNKYIATSSSHTSLKKLKSYVKEKNKSNSCIFLGIFTKNTNFHIGNIKYEPINFETCEATMGILIGDPAWRGKSVFSEVFIATKNFLHEEFDIRTVYLGVDASNLPAIKAYKKIGFDEEKNIDTDHNSIRMIYSI